MKSTASIITGVASLLVSSMAAAADCPSKLPPPGKVEDAMLRECIEEISKLRSDIAFLKSYVPKVNVTSHRIGPRGPHVPGGDEGQYSNETMREVTGGRNYQICTVTKISYTAPDHCELVKKDDGDAWYINAGPNAQCQVTCFKIELVKSGP